MIEGLISVILPIYNIERYLERCLNSVVSQTYKNLEIVLVDDGSTDNCPQLCEKWSKNDVRFKVIHKGNAGLGMARNTGIEYANGEYICFFDSDDYIHPQTIEKAFETARREQADVVLFGFNRIDSNGRCIRSVIPNPHKPVYAGEEIQEILLPDMIAPDPAGKENINIIMSACMALYSMKTIKEVGWRFVSEREIIAEDVYSLLILYKYVKRAAIIPEALYNYCQNNSSLTRTYRRDRYEKIRYFHEQCLAAQKQLGYHEEIAKRLSEPYISFTISALKMIVETDHTLKGKLEEIKDIVDDPHLQQTLQEIDLHNASVRRKVFLNILKKRMYIVCYMLLKAGALPIRKNLRKK